MSGQSKAQTLLEQLAVQLRGGITPADRTRARLHMIDWLGCALAGRVSEAGRVFATVADGTSSGTAFFWGALGNVLEMDDVDKRALLHPGPSIVPAVLALAMVEKPSWDSVFDAIVVGYEATIRLGRAVGAGHYAQWHSTGTCGAIGAAAACAKLLGLSAEQTAHAMALGQSQMAGFWQTRHEPQSLGKQLHTAHAARAGLDAARLAAAGGRGPLSLLEGPQGMFAASCPDGDPRAVLVDYGSGWLIHDVSFKPWPACRHAHAAVDAALLAREAGITADKMVSIRVRTYEDALKFCDKPVPQSVIEAKFSLQHAIAVSLLDGPPTLVDFEMAAVVEPAIIALRDKVIVETAASYQARYPARFGAEITVQLADGAEQTFAAADALGDPENPMTDDQIMDKANMLAAAGGLSEPGDLFAQLSKASVTPHIFFNHIHTTLFP